MTTMVARLVLWRLVRLGIRGIHLWYFLNFVILMALGLLLRLRYRAYALRRKPRPSWLLRKLCVNALIGVAFFVAMWVIAGPAPLVDEVVLYRVLPYSFVSSFVLRCLLGPVCEELFWRLGIYASLRTTMGRAPAVAASCLAFALWHGTLVAALWVFIVGVLAAMTFERDRHVISPISLHIAFNMTGVVLSIWWFD
jgi:membrane protease YdiL (CAAX protease family)